MGLIVAIEGLPGCGKTTVIGMLGRDLGQRGMRVGMADIETVGHAVVLRAIARTYPLSHPARILLFWVLRLRQYEIIQELVDNVDIMFADRFWGSTLAFDVYGNQVPQDLIAWVGKHIKRQPDITLLFEAPLALLRTRKRAKTMSDPEFAQRVEFGYKELAERFLWHRIDATMEPNIVKERCLEIVYSAWLSRRAT